MNNNLITIITICGKDKKRGCGIEGKRGRGGDGFLWGDIKGMG